MNKAMRVARHEFLMTAANKAFVIITLLGPLLILAVAVLPGLAAGGGGGSAGAVVALVGGDGILRSTLAATLAEDRSSLAEPPDEGAAREGVLGGSYAAALVLGPGWESAASLPLFTKTGTDYILYGRIQAVLDAVSRQARATASGVDPAIVARILKSPSLEMHRLGADGAKAGSGGAGTSGSEEYLGILLTVLAFVMLMYMTVLLYGQLIGRSVLQEKTSRTVEIMLSSVSARDLLLGKILGPGVAGLIQYSFWILATLAASSLIGPALGIKIPSILTPANLGALVVFFIPAYFLYASIYAALGAGAEDEQHLTQLAWPLIIFLMVPMVLINMFVMHPGSIPSIVFSYFPLTSPIVMLIRVLVSRPAWWELALSYAILLASVGGSAFLAAKVFRIGILMTGKRRKLGEILRWASVK
jgi:ABC-2 type transport system permease protein